MESITVLLVIIGILGIKALIRYKKRKRRTEFYHDYLETDEWQRKRYIVLKRDGYKCVYCGAPATQVHHKRYSNVNIGKEPIDWLVSVCQECHMKRHSDSL